MSDVQLREIELPDFGEPVLEPTLPAESYRARIERALERARARKLDVLVVYADREHCANLAYLTGFDPRFEEAMLVLTGGATVFQPAAVSVAPEPGDGGDVVERGAP